MRKQEKGGGNDQNNRTFNGYCNHCGKKGHKEKDCWSKHPNLKKNRQGASVETDIIVSIIERSDSNEQKFKAENAPRTVFTDGFELEDENLTQMKFPEVKIEDEIELQNDEENGVDFEIFTPVFGCLCKCDENSNHVCQTERRDNFVTN